MGQHFQLHLCLEFCQESQMYKHTPPPRLTDNCSQTIWPPWTMLGQWCHHSKGTSEAWLSSSQLWAEIHSLVAVVVFLTQKSETQVCNGMAGWVWVSCSWEKTAALNNLGHPDPLHCSLHCLCIFVQLHYIHRDWLALSQIVASRPLFFRDKQSGTLRMVGWLRNNAHCQKGKEGDVLASA